MNIKVCGLTSAEQLRQLQELNVQYAGLIFYKGSKRFAGQILEAQKQEVRSINIKKTGVFVNEKMDVIERAINNYDLHMVQLHGDETDEFCAELMDKVKVVKVFKVAGEEDINALTDPFSAVCDYFLFDTATIAYGGSGKQFDWSMLQKATISKPFFLSGGIGLADVERLKAFNHPHLHAVDVNSCFEWEPGKKDMIRVKEFVKKLSDG